MIEESKRRLKTDVLDLVQIHSLNGVDVLFPHLNDLKRKGQIRYIGITTSSSSQHDAMVELINTQPLDFIQVDYSLGNRAAADDGAAGGAGQTRGGADQSAVRRATRRQPVLARGGSRPARMGRARSTRSSWGQVFLKYVVSHPAVTVAIPGMTRLAHLEDNLGGGCAAACRTRRMRARMEKYWDQNFDG